MSKHVPRAAWAVLVSVLLLQGCAAGLQARSGLPEPGAGATGRGVPATSAPARVSSGAVSPSVEAAEHQARDLGRRRRGHEDEHHPDPPGTGRGGPPGFARQRWAGLAGPLGVLLWP